MTNVFTSPQFKPLTNTELRATPVPISDGFSTGTWSYRAGIVGSVTLTAGERALQITATAGSSAAYIQINGGDSITIPAGKSLTIEPRGNLFGATIQFTNTEAYFIEKVS